MNMKQKNSENWKKLRYYQKRKTMTAAELNKSPPQSPLLNDNNNENFQDKFLTIPPDKSSHRIKVLNNPRHKFSRTESLNSISHTNTTVTSEGIIKTRGRSMSQGEKPTAIKSKSADSKVKGEKLPILPKITSSSKMLSPKSRLTFSNEVRSHEGEHITSKFLSVDKNLSMASSKQYSDAELEEQVKTFNV
eukprot:UN23749